jgi:hypothetical protein
MRQVRDLARARFDVANHTASILSVFGRPGLPFGVVNAPGQRYHPAVIAQAIGILGAMYAGRFWAALGSGEASNEHITSGGWPRKDGRCCAVRT